MKNKMTDLNNHLFMALERLGDESLSAEELNAEIERSKAIANVARAITENGQLAFQVKRHLDEYGIGEGYSIPLLDEGK